MEKLKTDTSQSLRDELCSGEFMDKEGLVDAILNAWRHNHKLGVAIAGAALVGQLKLTNENWKSLFCAAHNLLPLINPESSGKQPIRAWMASHASNIGDVLWAGNYARARQMLLKGVVSRTLANVSMPRTQPRRVMKKEQQGLVFVKARDLSKRHDWSTVK